VKTRLALLLGLAAILLVAPVLERSLNPYVLQVAILCGINIILAVGLNLINGFTGQFSIGHAGFMAVGARLGGVHPMRHEREWLAHVGGVRRRARSRMPVRRARPGRPGRPWGGTPGRLAIPSGCAAITWRS
jgi:ABC-type branched-subunit amino acid transport system permease subunit